MDAFSVLSIDEPQGVGLSDKLVFVPHEALGLNFDLPWWKQFLGAMPARKYLSFTQSVWSGCFTRPEDLVRDPRGEAQNTSIIKKTKIISID